ncbi:MAG: DUF1778 domain-containing protein [Lamprobacter sp.]|uniref:type II toxin-antitoxin system TacA family antitoxin n=1 Tax=Lamprobacter sp. TaxID=3100796 RepID=UPI002B25F7E5|nr:DUF1778 domain-containing protein [Lamprobacter sp.]MEA3639079.1 DUF1778 domain-containing protein [Lamprobacter sp.]
MSETLNSVKQHHVKRLEARITPEQKQLLSRAAALEGQSLADFVVSRAQKAAKETLLEHERLRLSRRDQEAFVEALLDDEPPSELLHSAAQRYLQRQQS